MPNQKNHRCRRTTLAAATVLLLATAILSAACGDDATTGSEGTTVSTAAAGAGNCPTEKATIAEVDKRGAPQVTVPAQPATELKSTDLVVGTGDEVKAGAEVVAHYTGVGQATGKQFDSSWDRGQPVQFGLDQVIPGWSQGLVGMKVGGRRELVIPGELAYGANPPSPDIQPNETLVFVVDMIGTC